MELKKQVCSLDLAKRLKELGAEQESLFDWWVCHAFPEVAKPERYKEKHWKSISYSVQPSWVENKEWGHTDKLASAFTVAELGEMLPGAIVKGGVHKQIFTDRFHDEWLVGYTDIYDDDKPFMDTEADARAEILIYLVQNDLWTVRP